MTVSSLLCAHSPTVLSHTGHTFFRKHQSPWIYRDAYGSWQSWAPIPLALTMRTWVRQEESQRGTLVFRVFLHHPTRQWLIWPLPPLSLKLLASTAFYILNRKHKASAEVQPSFISPGEGKNKLFWQERSGSLNKQQTGFVSLELASLGTRQTTRTEGQPRGSASRAPSPGPGFHKRTQTSFLAPCQVHLFSKHPGFLHLIYYENTSKISPILVYFLVLWMTNFMRAEHGLNPKSGLSSQIHSSYCVTGVNFT